MPPDALSFSAVNVPSAFSLPRCMDYFTLPAAPNTDLWRRPPNGHTTSTAPIVFASLQRPFAVAEVTVSADWEMEFDQGGLVIFAGGAPTESAGHHCATATACTPTPTPTATAPTRPGRPVFANKWVKAGMEFSCNTVNASSVSATADGADWCLSPLCVADGIAARHARVSSLRIKLERIGYALWIWYQLPSVSAYMASPGAVGSTWKKLREVTWFFYGVEDKSVHVGVYASRPTTVSRHNTVWASMNSALSAPAGRDSHGMDDCLVVEFEDLEII